ncbi:MAG: DegV family EDD domain-containing protein [Fervidobacterium sp.]|nr:DegV family EDD domain-containing protein [Fervidobacterium sp.]
MKNAIVIDSTTKLRNDFLNEISDKVDVRIVPVRVYINNEEFEDSDELSERIVEAIKNKEKVETSLPNISTVESVFEELSKKYDRVYVLSVSSLLSGTYSLFSTIASKYENILVFDSKTVSIQNTYIFERMVLDILDGKNLEEDDIISYRDDSLFLISVFNLEQLHKSGRIGKVVSLIGQMIHIKPILTIARTGEVELVDKTLSKKKILDVLNKRIGDFIEKSKNDNNTKYILYAAVGLEEYKDYVYEVSKNYNLKPKFLDVGPAITAHVGLDAFGVVVGKL